MNTEAEWRSEITAEWPDASIRIHGECSPMVDPTQQEIRAIELASDPAGEYLESTGKDGWNALTYNEWMTFLEVVVTAYEDGKISPKNEHRGR